MIHPPASDATAGPFGVDGIISQLREIGIRPKDKLIVHASLSSMGWVIGGGVALLRALIAAVGDEGCIMVPTFTTYLTDPATWISRPVPELWHESIRASLPGFDPFVHATQPGIGRFAEIVRTAEGATRSTHPVYSLAALGGPAASILSNQPLDWALGRTSPLARFVDADGKILSIGIPWWRKCTIFHLSEHLASYPGRREYELSGRIRTRNGDAWARTRQLVFHDGDFRRLGHDLEGIQVSGKVGAAEAELVDSSDLASSARDWMVRHRDFREACFPAPYSNAKMAPGGEL